MSHTEQLTTLFDGLDEQLRVAAGLEALNAYQHKHGAEPRFTQWYRKHAGLEDLGDGLESVGEALQKTWDTIKRIVASIIKALKDGWGFLTNAKRRRDDATDAAKQLGKELTARRQEIEAQNKDKPARWDKLAFSTYLIRVNGRLDFAQLAKDITADEKQWLGVIKWLQEYTDKLDSKVRGIFTKPNEQNWTANELHRLTPVFSDHAVMLGGLTIGSSATGFPVFNSTVAPSCEYVNNPLQDIAAVNKVIDSSAHCNTVLDKPLEKLHNDALKLTEYIGTQLERKDWDKRFAPHLRLGLELVEQISNRANAIANQQDKRTRAIHTILELLNRQTKPTKQTGNEDLELDCSNWGSLF